MLQEVILNSIARRDEEGTAQNIFMVGDVKQSIYSFRFAQPRAFPAKARGLSSGSESAQDFPAEKLSKPCGNIDGRQ